MADRKYLYGGRGPILLCLKYVNKRQGDKFMPPCLLFYCYLLFNLLIISPVISLG
jgi:hypothetical protein